MKNSTFKGVIENAYGKPLSMPVNYSGSFEEVEKGDVIPAKEVPSEDDILSFVNNKRKANARQKAMADALTAAGVVKPTLEDFDERVRQFVKILTSTGMAEDAAKTFAENTLRQAEAGK